MGFLEVSTGKHYRRIHRSEAAGRFQTNTAVAWERVSQEVVQSTQAAEKESSLPVTMTVLPVRSVEGISSLGQRRPGNSASGDIA